MSFPQSEGKPLIPEANIQRYGPRRLKKAQGFHRHSKTGVWAPKIKPAVPDVNDRAKLIAAQTEAATKTLPTEKKPFDLAKYKPLLGRCLLRVGDAITSVAGVHIPDEHQKRDETLVVVKISGKTDFKVGDRVTLDHNAHKRPVAFEGFGPHVIVMNRYVATVLSSNPK